jgi:Lactate racemase N-terminal domain
MTVSGMSYSTEFQLPRMVTVRQNFADLRIPDIAAAVERELAESDFLARVPIGAKVAIGVGSRGIANIHTIAGTVVRFWKAADRVPFIFPAMGSHGAATPEGQAAVLAAYGITEDMMGCPVKSHGEVVSLGKSESGIQVFLDRCAFEADAVMPIARIKWHTDFSGRVESGLLKMIAIGFGKFAGARQYHLHAYRKGLEAIIREVSRVVLKSGKVMGGIAVLEDANHQTARVTAIPAEEIERQEEELLRLVKGWMPRIPVPAVDLLIVDEMGKDISGAGIDPKVVNRAVDGTPNPWPDLPRIERVYVRGLSMTTHGNADGVGLADIVHSRLVSMIDWDMTSINSLTSMTPAAIRLPIHYPTDRECLERILPTCGRIDTRDLTLAWIRNSLELRTLALSENLVPQLQNEPLVELLGSSWPLSFDSSGQLLRAPMEADVCRAS